MRWDDEPYVRLYKRETPEWSVLSWQARALFHELLKRVDMAGLLMVGKSGVRGLAGLVRMPLDVVEGALHGADGLLADGCVVEVDGGYLLPNFVEAQQARQSDRARKAEQRARDRAMKLASGKRHEESHGVTSGHTVSGDVTAPDNLGHSVTIRDHESQNVTESHDRSHEVTRGHSEQSRAEQRRDQIFPETLSPQLLPENRAAAGGDNVSQAKQLLVGTDVTEDAVLDELRRHPQLRHVLDGARHAPRTLRDIAARSGATLAQFVECVAYVASVTPDGEQVSATLGRLRGSVMKAHSRADAQRRRAAQSAPSEAAPPPRLPPGTGERPKPLPLPPRIVDTGPADNPVLRALGAVKAPKAVGTAQGTADAPQALGDVLAGLQRPSGET